MASALSSNIMPPEAPNPQQPASQGPLSAPLATQPMGSQPGPPNGQQAAPPPPPSHAQTVAALRHFHLVEGALTGLLKNPDCGKTDIRSEVIDSVTKLVSKGVTTPAEAVRTLSQFPDKPFDQKKAIEGLFSQVVQAQASVLAMHQHGAANGMPMDQSAPNPDDHQSAVSGLMAQFKGGAGG